MQPAFVCQRYQCSAAMVISEAKCGTSTRVSKACSIVRNITGQSSCMTRCRHLFCRAYSAKPAALLATSTACTRFAPGVSHDSRRYLNVHARPLRPFGADMWSKVFTVATGSTISLGGVSGTCSPREWDCTDVTWARKQLQAIGFEGDPCGRVEGLYVV